MELCAMKKNKILFIGALIFAQLGFAQTYDLPIIFVDTKGECLGLESQGGKNEKIPATMRVLDGSSNQVADSAKGTLYDIGIKVRGQSSAMFPKPGYSIEVRDAAGEGIDVSMLGLPPSDDWVFHGPYVDKSMLRNALAHWLFRQAGRYSPRTMHFDLYINGVYRGVYVLIEKIKRGKYRVDVSKLKEEDIEGDELTGGYVWAFDKAGTNTGGAGSGDVNDEGFATSDGLNVILHYPKKDKIQKQQEEYLKKYLNDLEGLFKNGGSGNGYDKYVDIPSAVDYVLHQELSNNGDSYWCSFFLYKDKDSKGGKVSLGPPWDFNLAMSNGSMMMGMGGGSGSSQSWQIENSSKQVADNNGGGGGMWGGFGGFGGSSLKAPRWLTGMWKDNSYQSELKKRWAELRSGVWHTKTMDKYLDSMKVYLKNAADRNFKRWPNLGKSSGQYDDDPEPMKFCSKLSGGFQMGMGGNNADTWDGEVEHLRKAMKERFAWMDQKFGYSEPANPVVTEPIIHIPVIEDEKDTVPEPPPMLVDYTRLAPYTFFVQHGNQLEIHAQKGGKFALMDLNGKVLFKTNIKAGATTLTVPEKARNVHWIATLNGKMLSK